MKNHIGMYLLLAAVGVALLSRPAAAAGEMVAGGSVVQNVLATLTGQYAGGGGSHGSASIQTPSGTQTLTFG